MEGTVSEEVWWRDSFNVQVLQGKANHFISSVFPHPTGTGTWRVEGARSVSQSSALSSALPERSRADIMESDSLLASLSADGEMWAVTWWLACQQESRRSCTKLSHWLAYPPTLNKTGGLLAAAAQPVRQIHLSVCNDHPNTDSTLECQTHWVPSISIPS